MKGQILSQDEQNAVKKSRGRPQKPKTGREAYMKSYDTSRAIQFAESLADFLIFLKDDYSIRLCRTEDLGVTFTPITRSMFEEMLMAYLGFQINVETDAFPEGDA